MLLVADFKAHTALEQVSGSHSVGCGVEAVAGAVSGLDEVSVVHVLVDSFFDIGHAHTSNVGGDGLQASALGDEFSLAAWVGVLLVELENGLVLRSFDLVVLESLPHSLHLSLHLVENTHSSSGDFDVTVSASIRLWNVSVHAEQAAVRVAGKLALEGDDVFRVQVSAVAALFNSSNGSLSRVELHERVGRMLSMLDGIVVLASNLSKNLEDGSLSWSVRAGNVETKSEPAVLLEIVSVLELVTVELAGLVGSNSAGVGGNLTSDSAELLVADSTGSNDGQVGSSKSFTSEGENVFVGGLVDSRGGSVRRGRKTRQHKARHMSVVLADNLFVSRNSIERGKSMSSVGIRDGVGAHGSDKVLGESSSIAGDGGAENTRSLAIDVGVDIGAMSSKVVQSNRSVDGGLRRSSLVSRAAARNGADDSD